VFLRGLDRWLERLSQAERASASVHNRIASRISRALRGAPAGRIQSLIASTFSAFEGDRMEIIERSVFQAGEIGGSMTTRSAEALFGRDGARQALSPVIDPGREIASSRLAGRGDESIRALLRRRTGRLGRHMAEEVRRSVALSETTQELAQRTLRARDITVRVPRYIERVRELSRTAPPSAVRSTVRRQLDGLRGRLTGAPQDIRREMERFLRDVERSGGADIERATETWVRGRANNQAMTIARTEGQGALNEAYVASHRDQPWVVGMKWNLSPAHEKPDICDVMAAQDLHGLGAGVYPPTEVPALAHPNDLCYFTAVTDTAYLEREQARVRGEEEPPRPWVSGRREDGRQWLQRQPEALRRQILGPGRAREFGRRPTRVVNADGSFNPLYTIQGRPPPPLPEGERFVHRRNGEVESLVQVNNRGGTNRRRRSRR
jgi:hypothetical protein